MLLESVGLHEGVKTYQVPTVPIFGQRASSCATKVAQTLRGLSEVVALGRMGPHGCQGLLKSKAQYKC